MSEEKTTVECNKEELEPSKQVSETKLEEIKELDADQYLAAPKIEVRFLEDYRKLKDEKTIFQQTFSIIDQQNTLYAFAAGGIKIKMTSKHIDGFYHGKNSFSKTEALSKSYNVVVVDIVEDEKLVYVSANEANAEPRERVRALLDEGIKEGVYKIVKAKVIGISSDKDRTPGREVCLLNIGGLGIMGTMRLGDWSRCFTPSFRFFLKKDDIVRVAVTGTARWSSREDPVYVCSRKLLLTEDPWKDLEKKLHARDVVCVTCTDRQKDNFFGKIAGFDELNAYCYYPDDEDYIIEAGKSYIGVIAKVSETRRELKVRFPKNIE